MNVEYVPLLRTQRDLHDVPRGMERFRQYLRTITNDEGTGLELPSLGIMNPMGREHVSALLDALMALDADGIAARAAAEATVALKELPGDFKLGLVVADDLKGGWTNRYDQEYGLRFGRLSGPLADGRLPKWLKHHWLTGILWSSEPASAKAVREAVLTTLYRLAYVHEHGSARNLREMIDQEGHVMTRAGCTGPKLDDEDIAYTREVLVPFLDVEDKRTVIECMFGDPAGKTLGFTPRGLSHWAGLALALHDARHPSALPEPMRCHSGRLE